ncbi:hypothetical protein [Labrenzia sp. 011]|uniref:hypothetical protein n=1 Tax=Labrenzia sp. 011 TaxID=2171494 RepID=UPI000D51AF2E|nr:hypothetical protein [Labrenzia sp. 011]PVB60821.1 hypothetical protein DCO57_15525 [Labrenzia sp. 011]
MSGYELFRILTLGGLILGAGISRPASQETRDARRARNCGYYREMVRHAFESIDKKALTPRFAADHEAFIEGGCLAVMPACPASSADFAFADMLLMMTVSANMGSTFTPFWCPVKEGG